VVARNLDDVCPGRARFGEYTANTPARVSDLALRIVRDIEALVPPALAGDPDGVANAYPLRVVVRVSHVLAHSRGH